MSDLNSLPVTTSVRDRLRIFYDGSCPICAGEIGFYQRQIGGNSVSWVDLRRVTDAEFPTGVGREQALERFHVIDDKGVIFSGARAFAELWAALPALAVFGRGAGIAPIRQILELGYTFFLWGRPVLKRIFALGRVG